MDRFDSICFHKKKKSENKRQKQSTIEHKVLYKHVIYILLYQLRIEFKTEKNIALKLAADNHF